MRTFARVAQEEHCVILSEPVIREPRLILRMVKRDAPRRTRLEQRVDCRWNRIVAEASRCRVDQNPCCVELLRSCFAHGYQDSEQ